jgi:sigma-70-like protein
MKRMTKRELAFGKKIADAMLEELGEIRRPLVRADCLIEGSPRPCPFVSCKYNLYLDVHPRNGSLKLNFPDLEVHEMDALASCVLDVTEFGPASLEQTGQLMNMTRERVRQIAVRAENALVAAFQPIVDDALDEGRDAGLPRAPEEAERDAGPSHLDAREVIGAHDEFFIDPPEGFEIP